MRTFLFPPKGHEQPIHAPLLSGQIFVLSALRSLCGAASWDGQGISSLLQKERLDWDGIISTADRHRISAFLACALKKAQVFRHLPVPVQSLFKSAAEKAAIENLAKMIEFKKCSRFFAEQNIPVIPLKGIALTHAVYEEMPLRRMGDIDVFVKEGDLAKIKQLLGRRGFREKAFANLWHTGIANRLAGRGSYIKNNLDIDLQWRPSFYISGNYVIWNAEEAWKEKAPCPALGETAYLFSPRHQAQYLLLQIANDFDQDYLFLFQLLDLALVIKKFDLKTAQILEEVSGRLKPEQKPQIEKLLRAVYELFLSKEGKFSPDTGEIIRAVFESELNPRAGWGGKSILPAPISWSEKLIFFAGYFFPDPEYIRQQYGTGIGAWGRGYCGHWARLMRKAMTGFSTGAAP